MSGITNPAEEYFKDGLWGWDGSAWRKLPLLFGYSDGWGESASGTASGAGDASADTTEVPAGYIYVLQAVSAYHNAGANKEVTITANVSGVNVILFNDLAAVTGTWYPVICNVVLKEDDFVNAYVAAPGDGKICYLRVGGYKMKIAE